LSRPIRSVTALLLAAGIGVGTIAGCGGGSSGTDAGTDGEIDGGGDGDADGDADVLVEWPDPEHPATSDPWIVENHDRLRVMRPRVLALNFVNGHTNDEMLDLFGNIVTAMREGSRPHGFEDAGAEPFLEIAIPYAVDLTDTVPPEDWPYRNSTAYPREDPVQGQWGFDYEQLFDEEFAALYGIDDPEEPGRPLTLCELSERGLVHEVWIYGDADVPDVGAAEILGLQPYYDDDGVRHDGPLDRCAGNGCFDDEDEIPDACTRTLRIGWVNSTRGVGCYLESTSHGIEAIGQSFNVPAFSRHFHRFAGFDLDERYDIPFTSWYACREAGCLSYPDARSVEYEIEETTGRIDDYDPVCGNIHFPPNAREHYDITHSQPVDTTCVGFRRGGGAGGEDVRAPLDASAWLDYDPLAPDCTGAWGVFWWQTFPGRDRQALEDDGTPLQNWWPFLYY
jgi:hypothetical protein